jgi:hypothetical protein
MIDSLRLSYAIIEAGVRGHIELPTGTTRGHLTIPYKLIHVLVECQVLLAICLGIARGREVALTDLSRFCRVVAC